MAQHALALGLAAVLLGSEWAVAAAPSPAGWAVAAALVGQKSKLDEDEEETKPAKAPPKKDAAKEPAPEPKPAARQPDAPPPKESPKAPPGKTPPDAGPAPKKPAEERSKAPSASRSAEEEEETPAPKRKPSKPLEDPSASSSQPKDDGSTQDKKGPGERPARKKAPVRKPPPGRNVPDAGKTDGVPGDPARMPAGKKPAASKADEEAKEPRPAGGRGNRKTTIDAEETDSPRDRAKPTVIDQEDEENDVFDLLYLNDPARPVVKIQLLEEELDFSKPFLPGPKVKGDSRREFEVFPPGSGKRFLLYHDVKSVEPYEERVVARVADFLKLRAEKLVTPGNASHVAQSPVAERIPKADTMLTQALAEHDSAVQRGLRADSGWSKRLRDPLVQARINVRLCRIDQLIQQGAANAEIACERLAAEVSSQHPGFDDLRQRADRIVGAKARAALERNDFALVRDLLEGFAGRYPPRLGPEGRKIQDALVDRATQLLREAEKLKATAPQKATEQLELAAKIWPRLAGLDASRRAMDQDYPILRCSYSELPRTLCPLMARTPVERHASSLVCESLVRWVDDREIGSHYATQLAQGLPQPLARGRAFQLPKCRWLAGAAGASPASDAAAPTDWCMADDVRFTVKVLHDRQLPWYSPLYGELLPQVEDASDGDPFSFSIYLKKDYWQPLALMDFKILPKRCFSQDKQGADLAAELETFGRNPVGTGPYQLAPNDRETPNQRRFTANPYYRVAGQPRVREIVFQRQTPTQAVELFLQRKNDLIWGLQPEHVNQLQQQGKDVRTLQPPTVWFLAPNHRNALLKNKSLRLAIAHGIDREAILRQYFRPGRGASDHKALHGPFPPDCWAHNPNVTPFSPARAKAYLETAQQEIRRPIALRLVYPAGGADVEKACQQIEMQLKAIGVTVKLEKPEPDDFYRQVIDNRNFDLVYWSYTFPDVTYSLEPLLRPDQHDRDATLRNAWNIMGYVPDADIETLFQNIHARKQFREIQQLAHRVHEHVVNEAILIPLWQLYVYVAVGDRLNNPTVNLDPLTLFADVQQWTLQSGR